MALLLLPSRNQYQVTPWTFSNLRADLQAGEKELPAAMDARPRPPGCFIIVTAILSPFIPYRVPFVIFYSRLSGVAIIIRPAAGVPYKSFDGLNEMKLTGSTLNLTGLRLLIIFLALAFPKASEAQSARERILAEMSRLEKILPSLKLSDEEKGQRAAAIETARQTLQAGNLYLGLYRLQPLWVEIMAQSYAASKADVEAKGTAGFEREWQRLGLELAEKEKRLATLPMDKSPVAVRALAEVSLTQVRPYYQSGRLYGLNTTIGNGLYYMGLAPANLDFAILCRELRVTETGRPQKLRSLGTELSKLEAEILESYRRLESAESQPQFNRLNATLKMAVELDREGRYSGALLKYLDATLFLNLLTQTPAGTKDLARLQEQSRLMDERLKRAGAVDHSIGLIYLASARATLDEAARGRSDAEALKRAAVIIDRVLPSYFETSGDK